MPKPIGTHYVVHIYMANGPKFERAFVLDSEALTLVARIQHAAEPLNIGPNPDRPIVINPAFFVSAVVTEETRYV